jgi:hypothetical protein
MVICMICLDNENVSIIHLHQIPLALAYAPV